MERFFMKREEAGEANHIIASSRSDNPNVATKEEKNDERGDDRG